MNIEFQPMKHVYIQAIIPDYPVAIIDHQNASTRNET